MVNINLSKCQQPDYLGSVQELYFLKDHPEWMVCKTTVGGSVFDVGTIFSIPGSDICRTAVRHKIYSLLESAEEWKNVRKEIENLNCSGDYRSFLQQDALEQFMSNGAGTHHLGMIEKGTGKVYKNSFPPDPSPYVLVKKYSVIKPRRVKHFLNNLWDYSEYYGADKYVVPLENIVRFGITPNSSIYKKYLGMNDQEKDKYLAELGQESLVPWSPFPVPTVDFTTKYEPEDRNLSLQEALYVSGCSSELFKNIIRMSILGSLLVYRFFKQLDLNLWDLKWEIARDNGQLVFVDTIDTDSIRVTAKIDYNNKSYFVNFNKQSMRDYYTIMHPDWFAATKSAKAAAAKTGESFTEHLRKGQEEGFYPKTPRVDERFINIQEEKFSALVSYIYGQSSRQQTIDRFRSTGRKEIQYYESNNVLKDFAKVNGI